MSQLDHNYTQKHKNLMPTYYWNIDQKKEDLTCCIIYTVE